MPTQDETTLFEAIENNRQEEIQSILQKDGFDVNCRNSQGKPAIFVAAHNGNSDAVKALAASGADVNVANQDGTTPVCAAAQNGHSDTIKTLKELGADVNAANQNGATPVFIAAERGHSDVIKTLAELGADVNVANQNGTTPFLCAVAKGYSGIIKTLAKLGVDINIPHPTGFTPVFIAAATRQNSTIITLAELGADVNVANQDGTTPVCAAAQNGHSDTIKTLKELGADVNAANQNGATPVFIAAQHGRSDVIKTLAELGADIHKARNDGVTPVFIAASNKHNGTIKTLAKLEVDIHKPHPSGNTLVFFAAANGHSGIIETLAELGADVNAANQDGVTSVCIAAERGHSDTIKTLAGLGADIHKAKNDGVTPVLLAVNNGHINTIRLLSGLGADLNTNTRLNTTPIQRSIDRKQLGSIAVLISEGVDCSYNQDDKEIKEAIKNGYELRKKFKKNETEEKNTIHRLLTQHTNLYPEFGHDGKITDTLPSDMLFYTSQFLDTKDVLALSMTRSSDYREETTKALKTAQEAILKKISLGEETGDFYFSGKFEYGLPRQMNVRTNPPPSVSKLPLETVARDRESEKEFTKSELQDLENNLQSMNEDAKETKSESKEPQATQSAQEKSLNDFVEDQRSPLSQASAFDEIDNKSDKTDDTDKEEISQYSDFDDGDLLSALFRSEASKHDFIDLSQDSDDDFLSDISDQDFDDDDLLSELFRSEASKKNKHENQDQYSRENFKKFGSPQNFVDNRFRRHEDDDGKKLGQSYYSNSQNDYANLTMESLIRAHHNHKPEDIFQLSQEGVSADEINKIERLYQSITEDRLQIAQKTARDKNDVHFELLDYETFKAFGKSARTPINGNMYTRYHDILMHEDQERIHYDPKLFDLNQCSSLLGVEEDSDARILLGAIIPNFFTEEKGVLDYNSGDYRESAAGMRQENNIERVDYVTALAAKKCFQADDEDEALKYAFVFAALRGHNHRSTQGTCWAMEQSLRWVFAHKGWEQFNKLDGINLEIDAVYSPAAESFEEYIDKMVESYKSARDGNVAEGSDAFFDVSQKAQDREYEQFVECIESKLGYDGSRKENTLDGDDYSSEKDFSKDKEMESFFDNGNDFDKTIFSASAQFIQSTPEYDHSRDEKILDGDDYSSTEETENILDEIMLPKEAVCSPCPSPTSFTQLSKSIEPAGLLGVRPFPSTII